MEQPQEAATEAKPEGSGRFGLVGEARVVQPQFLEGLPQVVELVAVNGIEPTEHHGLRLAVAIEDISRAVATGGDGFAGTRFSDVFDPG